jgi:branched-chain amino acid aminotransferase
MQTPLAVSLNGTVVPVASANVSVFDRSYLYGDSLYEVIRSKDGKFIYMPEHLERLAQSAKLCAMRLDQPMSEYVSACEKTWEAFRKIPGQKDVDVYCRIILSRGVGKIGFGLGNLQTPTQYTVIVQPLEPPTAEHLKRGFRYKIVSRYRNHPLALDPAMKSGNYLNSLLAYLEAADEGYDDALMCDNEGFLTEGTTFNLFYVRNGVIATSPLDVGILDGITRRKVIELAREMGYSVREVRYTRERLFDADEVFMSSTIKDVFPVTELDKKRIRGGKPGPITLKLKEAFQSRMGHSL